VEQAERDLVDASGREVLAAMEAQRGATETVQVGPFRVLATTQQSDLAAELFEQVWREDFGAVTGSPSLARSVFAFEWWTTTPSHLYMGAVAPGSDRSNVARVEVGRLWVPTRDGLRAAIRQALWHTLREDFPADSPLREWLYESGYLDAEDTYRVLATRASGPSRACLTGEVDACAVGLGLIGPSYEVLATWFTLRDLQQTVGASTAPWVGAFDRDDPTVRACIDDDDRAACVRAVSTIPEARLSLDPPRVRYPTTSEAQVRLVWHAIRLGGEGAWLRAIEDTSASPAAVLTRASGRSTEELVESWIAELAQHRPAAYAGLGRSGWLAALWLLALTAFAMRSTRWRLG
jgi:hypothetical protein